MTDGTSRDLVAHCVIVAAVCLAGWLFMVKPREKQLRTIETTIVESSNSTDVNHESVQKMADAIAECRDRILEIEQYNTFGDDTSRLYGKLSNVASQQNVRVLHMDPGRPATELTGGGGQTRVVDVSVRGSFEAIVSYVAIVENLAGFVRPMSLTVAPTRGYDGQDVVDARLTFELLRFDVPVLSVARGEMTDDA